MNWKYIALLGTLALALGFAIGQQRTGEVSIKIQGSTLYGTIYSVTDVKHGVLCYGVEGYGTYAVKQEAISCVKLEAK